MFDRFEMDFNRTCEEMGILPVDHEVMENPLDGLLMDSEQMSAIFLNLGFIKQNPSEKEQ